MLLANLIRQRAVRPLERMNSPLERRKVRLRGLRPQVKRLANGYENSDGRFLGRAPGSVIRTAPARRSLGMTDCFGCGDTLEATPGCGRTGAEGAAHARAAESAKADFVIL